MAVAIVAIASCQKEVASETGNGEKTVKFVAQSIDTKTAFGAKNGDSYPTLWTENDSKVKISLNFTSPKDAVVTPAADFKTATFEADLTDDESGSYTFYSLSPYTAFTGLRNDNSFTITIPTAQNPTTSSVDEAAQILAAKSSALNSWPSEVAFDYSHVTAYGKMSITNLNLGTATITSISLTAAEDWVGRWNYYPESGNLSANSASATITLNSTSLYDLWFACAPVDLGGKKITVTVNTTAGPYVREITWPAGKAFTSGKVYKFAVDMNGISPSGTKTYTKVTDKNQITVDSELIIVANSYNFAISTTQNSNNRAPAGVTKSESGETITDPASDVQVFKAKKGNKTNTIAFYCEGASVSETDQTNVANGYLSAASSSSNYLRTKEEIDDNASFSLDITGGKSALVAQGTFTRNTIRYNNGNPSCFACYASAQQDVCIYKLDGSGTSTPIFTAVPKHTLTYSGDGKGSVTATVKGALVSSGAQIEEGTVVTISASANSGYTFSNWTITGATPASTTAASTTITVGTSDIDISATFDEMQGDVAIFDWSGASTDTKSAEWTSTENGVSLTWNKGTAQNTPSPNKEGSIRMYTNTTVTVTAPSGKKVTRIEFTPTADSYSASKLSYNGSAISDDWTLPTPASPIVLTATANARFKKIIVHFE